MSTRRTRHESQLLTRQRLLDAAAQAFAREGYRGATLAQIADEAGFTIGAVYSNFGGKEELFIAALDERLGSVLDAAAKIFLEAPTLAEAAREAGGSTMARLRDDPDWFPLFVEAWVFALRDQEFRPRFSLRQQQSHAALAVMLEQRLADEGLTPDKHIVKTAALAIKALFHGVALELATNPDAVPEDALGASVGLLLTGVSAELTGWQPRNAPRTAKGKPLRRGRIPGR
jgi:AcrR family transcriptional regulator